MDENELREHIREQREVMEGALWRCSAIGCGHPDRHPVSGYTGGVVLTPEEADALIAKLREPRL